ncbi:uncharacterized protein LOC129872092 isoform X1 [Solanum dulcamara]|uniref:uncharacterized protein LOC129872092 isoform X1 n=1 Tax=Solanum dulcamara TaxID=45834 RepID=UPI002484E015|nr:uncharacterized protein LOC129872092 isoform X1 [Solanum dulcamara]
MKLVNIWNSKLQTQESAQVHVMGSQKKMMDFLFQYEMQSGTGTESLKNQVLSGQKRTTTYLDSKQELVVMPELNSELGLDLQHPFSSFRIIYHELNPIHKQPTSVTLLAVSPLTLTSSQILLLHLTLNLTHGILLKCRVMFCDGSSMEYPPSVNLILNNKACRYERICFEELLEKVMPEIGYQLLHNYADQIQNWGWICNIHSQASRSFTRNLNLIHKQPTSVTLLVVYVAIGSGTCYVKVDDHGRQVLVPWI